jgi:hypothetical protein
MTVNTQNITSGPFVGNDIATQFSYTFRVEDKTQLAVFETDLAGARTQLTVDTDYTVGGIGTDGGGLVTRVAGALPLNFEWFIRADYQSTQLTAFPSQGPFFPDVHEASFDQLTFLIQQLEDARDRSFKLSDTTDIDGVFSITQDATGRANKFLSFDASGNLVVSTDPAVLPSSSEIDLSGTKAVLVGKSLDSGVTAFTQGYNVAGDRGGRPYLIKTAAQAGLDGDVIDGFGNLTLANGNVAIMQYSEGVLHSKWFGAKGDADYAEWVASQTTNNSTNEYANIQAMLTRSTDDNVPATIDEGTFLLDPPDRLVHKTLVGERSYLYGAGVEKTFIFNTLFTAAGDLFSSQIIGGPTSGVSHYEGFTILETHQGDLDGTGGVNGVTNANGEGIVVKNLEVLKCGNRAIGVESNPKIVKIAEFENVYVRDAWKNGIIVNGLDQTGTIKARISFNNVEVNGYNLIANEIGGLDDQNQGVSIPFPAGAIPTVDISTPLRIKNGFAQAFSYLGPNLSGKIIVRDIETPDAASFTQTAAVFVSAKSNVCIDADIDGVIGGGGLLTIAGDADITKISALRVRNADLYDFRNGSEFHGVGFDLFRTDDKPNIAVAAKGKLAGCVIIGRKPFGTTSNAFLHPNGTLITYDGCRIETTGDGAGNQFYLGTEFTDLRKHWDVSKLPDMWFPVGGSTLATNREGQGGVRIQGVSPNAVGFIQADTIVDSGAGTYTIKAKLSAASGTMRVYISDGTVTNLQVLQLTNTTEQTVSGITFNSDNVTFKIGRTDSLSTDSVLEYLRLTQP